MAVKNTAQVVIDGKIITLGGYESEEYFQKVAAYMNNKISELSQMPGYSRQAMETKHTLLSLNITDDYFKAKKQAEIFEQDLQQKDQEMYDLKHELISLKMQIEEAKKAEQEAQEQKNLLDGKVKELEKELADAQNTSSANAEYIAQLESQSAELAQYKQNEADFEAEKQKFYQEVVFSDSAPDIEEYKQYYESIDPADAEIIYRQVVEQTAANDEMDDYVKAYSSMKPKEAAAIFDTMTDNLQLVADILDSMDAQSRANILGKMDAATAAKVTAIMEPVE